MPTACGKPPMMAMPTLRRRRSPPPRIVRDQEAPFSQSPKPSPNLHSQMQLPKCGDKMKPFLLWVGHGEATKLEDQGGGGGEGLTLAICRGVGKMAGDPALENCQPGPCLITHTHTSGPCHPGQGCLVAFPSLFKLSRGRRILVQV